MRRWLRPIPALLGRTLSNFHRDHCLNLSAMVAFYALLALGPLA